MIRSCLGVIDLWTFDAALISRAFLPVEQSGSKLQEGLAMRRVLGEIIQFIGVLFKIVKLFEGACVGHDESLGRIEFTLGMPFPHGLDDGFGIFVVVGLQVGTARESVSDIFPFFASDASDPIDRFVRAIASGKDRFAAFVIRTQNVLRGHPPGLGNAG